MIENPIFAIENAELEAQQALLNAGEEKIRLIQKAKEEAEKAFIASGEKAELQANEIIKKANAGLEQENEQYNIKLEADKIALINKAKVKESAAFKSIMSIIRGTG